MTINRINSENDDHDALDFNAVGESFFDLIDKENARFGKELLALEQRIQQQRHQHQQNVQKIWESFGIHPRQTPNIRLTSKIKSQIRQRVRKWANST